MTIPAEQTATTSPETGYDAGDSLLHLVTLAGAAGQDGAVGQPIALQGRRYRDFLEALGVAVYTTDAAGRITFYNQAAADFWGRRPELGEAWCGSWRLYWRDGRSMRHDECPMAIALREDRPVRGEEAIAERPDGSRVTFVPYPTPLHDGDGTLIGAVNVLVDVTQRRLAEEALRATAEALRVSNAVKDEFLGLVSHELRTPVTTIFGNARLLHERGDRLSDADRRSMIGDIAADSERLLGVVENLLLLTRLDTGVEPELEPQILGHVVRKAVDSFVRRRPEAHVELVGADRQIIVEGDGTFLHLVLENLLSNAAKYGSATAPIEVVVGAGEGEATVVVLDRGIGIGEGDAEQLFAAFYRSEAAKRHAAGVGIGLTVCRRVIEAQGGRIWLRPRAGGGTEAGFALPLAR